MSPGPGLSPGFYKESRGPCPGCRPLILTEVFIALLVDVVHVEQHLFRPEISKQEHLPIWWLLDTVARNWIRISMKSQIFGRSRKTSQNTTSHSNLVPFTIKPAIIHNVNFNLLIKNFELFKVCTKTKNTYEKRIPGFEYKVRINLYKKFQKNLIGKKIVHSSKIYNKIRLGLLHCWNWSY